MLRHIIEQCKEWQKSLVLNFVDFKKVFGCVYRACMWKILELSGKPVKILNKMRNMYDGGESRVRVGQGQTEFFQC